MAYPIKNTALVQPNSIKTGGFAVGVNQGGYGLTSVTAFWNGRPPSVNGYVVYVGNGTSSPTMYIVSTDSQLINLSNQLGGGSNTTVPLALYYFITSSNSVCFNVEPSNIVTNGLVINLDAGFTPSYPRDYNVWYDVSGSGNTGTLVNGPTFDSSGYGSIIFDGINNYVNCGNILNYTSGDFSFSYWIYVTSLTTSVGGSGPVIIYKGSFNTNGYYDQLNTDGSISFITNTAGANVYTNTVAGVISTGNTYNICYTRSGSSIKIYLNGFDVTNVTGTHVNPVSSSSNFIIASYGGSYINSNVKMYSFANYNKQLSVAEVLQNYYAGLQRFIPTNGLVLWLDGQNTNTRVITPTLAYDTSGYDNYGVLTNGVTLEHRSAGTSFLFDGVSNYINCGNSSNLQITVGSVNFWFKGTQQGLTYNGIVVKQNAWGVFIYQSKLQIYDWGNSVPRDTGINVSDNVWRNVCLTFTQTVGTPSNNALIYVNGVLSTTTTVKHLDNNNSLLLGYGNITSQYFQGSISQTLIYNRVLTATEISTIYTATKSRYGL